MTGVESVRSIIRELRKDVAAYSHPHTSGIVSIPSGYVWLLGSQDIRLGDPRGSSGRHYSRFRVRLPPEILQRVPTHSARGGLP